MARWSCSKALDYRTEADSSIQDLVCLWQHYSFHLQSDAWVFVSARKQFAGFACVWHRDPEEFYTFICMHPQYRKRGIGKLMRHARSWTRVSLRGVVSTNNAQAHRLFELEVYLLIREF